MQEVCILSRSSLKYSLVDSSKLVSPGSFQWVVCVLWLYGWQGRGTYTHDQREGGEREERVEVICGVSTHIICMS